MVFVLDRLEDRLLRETDPEGLVLALYGIESDLRQLLSKKEHAEIDPALARIREETKDLELPGEVADDPQKWASEYLKSKGVSGLQYLDAGSRSQGKGTHNFVIWDESRMSVEETFYQDEWETNPNAVTEMMGEFITMMSFFETANASSPFHELSHHILNIYDKLSDMEGVEEWIKQDFETVLKEFGYTKEQFRGDEAIRKDVHERFAKGFEVYVATGEAPSKTLRGVFENLRKWMVEIYGDVKAVLGIELSDDMRAVYDRLLATPEEIGAEYEARTKVGALAAEMTLIKDSLARTEAEDRAARETEEAWGNFDEGWLFEDLDAIALESVDGYLAYLDDYDARKAAHGAKKGILKGILDAGRMTYESLVHEVGREKARELQKKLPGLFKKDGLGIDVLAEAAGMDTQGLIQFIEEYSPPEKRAALPLLEVNTDTLNALVERVGVERTREYLTERKRYLAGLQKGIQSEYDLDKTNEGKKRDLEATYREQKEIAESVKALDELLKAKDEERAKEKLEPRKQGGGKATLTLEDAMKRGYEMAARYAKEGFNAGAEHARARLKERMDKLRAKQKALYEEKRKLNGLVKALNRMADDGTVIWGVKQEIQKKLAGYDLKKRRKGTLDRRAELEEFLKADPEAGDTMNAADLKFLGTTALNQMSIADVEKLHDEVAEMYERGKREYAEWDAARRERIDKKNAALRKALARIKPNLPILRTKASDTKKQYEGVRGKLELAKDWTASATLGAQRFFDWLDGGQAKYTGPFVKFFMDDFNAARDDELRHVFERREWIQEKLKDLGLNMRDFSKIRAKNVYGHDFTVDEIMEIYIGLRNEKKAAAILHGVFGGVDIDDAKKAVRALIRRLSQDEKKAAELVVEDHGRNVDRIESRLVEAFNRGMNREESYTSIHRIEHGSEQGLIDAESAEALAEGTAGAGLLGRVEADFMKDRVIIKDENQTGITLGLFSNWHNDVNTHEHAAAFGALARETVGALLAGDPVAQLHGSQQTVGRMIKERFGDQAWKTLTDYYNIAVKDDSRAAASVLDGVSSYLARNMSVTYLCYNLGTAMKQMTSVPRFFMTAGPLRILASIGQFMINPVGFMNEVYELDPQMRDRAGSPILRAIRENPNWGARGYQKMIRIGMEPIAIMDRWVAAIGWKATYDANLRSLGRAGAIREAQRAVALTQQTAHAKDASALWRQRSAARLAMIFTSDTAQAFGMTAYDFVQQMRSGQHMKALGTILGLTLSAMLMKAATDGPGDDEKPYEEEEGWAAWTLSAFSEQAIASIPLVGKEAMILYDRLTGKYRGTQYSAFMAPFDRALRAAQILNKGEIEEDEMWKAAGYALEALSLGGAAPLPVTGLKRSLRSLDLWMNDDDGFRAARNMVGMRR